MIKSVHVDLKPELVAMIDEKANEYGVTRTNAIRILIHQALKGK